MERFGAYRWKIWLDNSIAGEKMETNITIIANGAREGRRARETGGNREARENGEAREKGKLGRGSRERKKAKERGEALEGEARL